MTTEEELQRAQQALRLLDDPMFKAAREDLYGQLKAARASAPTTDSNLHSKLILMEQMADRFFGYFELIAQTGKFARLQLDQDEARKKSFADRMLSYANWGRNGL